MTDLADRLQRIKDSDHERGCMGRQYSCTCGYDDRKDALLVEAAAAMALPVAHAQDESGKPVAAGYIVKTINFLREEEGDSVTILCDNPDGPPNCAIECNGQWTGWEDKRFVGADLIEALSAAYLQCIQLRAAADYGKKWSETASQSPAEGMSPDQLIDHLNKNHRGWSLDTPAQAAKLIARIYDVRPK